MAAICMCQTSLKRTYLTIIWIQKYLILKMKTSHLEEIVQQVVKLTGTI